LKLHHIGYAVRDIRESVSQFELFGFELYGEITDDPQRNVKICFMRNQDTLVELIAPLNQNSPVSKWLEKNGCSPYHFCYESNNIKNDIRHFKENGAKEISKPLAAPAIEGKLVAFLYLSSLGIVELVENNE